MRILVPSGICEPIVRYLLLSQDEPDSPDLGQTGFTPTTKQQTDKTVPCGRFFHRLFTFVLGPFRTIDVEGILYTCITRSGYPRSVHVARHRFE